MSNYIDKVEEEEIPEIYNGDDDIDIQGSNDANECKTQLTLSLIESEKTEINSLYLSPPQEKTKEINDMTYKNPWKMPPIDMLLDAPENSFSEEDQRNTAGTIVRTLGEYGIEVTVKQIKPGPTVTMYGLEPGWNRRYKDIRQKDSSGQVKIDSYGRPIITQIENKTRVKVGSIVAREKDLALSLAASSIRIQAPVPGESVVGIEVPNANPSIVTLRSVMQSEKYGKLRARYQLPIAMGKGSGGEVVITDLTHMPHLLIAGATGSGKSVCINSIISCLLMEKSPEDLRFLLIDPKRVELNLYNGIPHLLRPTIVEADEAVNLLQGLIAEMFRRYKAFEKNGSRNILAFNKKTSVTMPYIVVVIDELADLMMTSQYQAENSVCRLAQLGRATGIHLVLATQRPSVNVVTGLIKANFPSRVSFAVASQVDSRTILDSAGADKLLGRGDMLYLPLDGLQPKRTQGVFISDHEIEGLVRHWTTVSGPPIADISLDVEEEEEEFPKDQLLDKAIDIANSHTTLSTSLLQRRLRIGYPRAARLMEQLEDEGIVAPGEPGKAREVI
jgi:S-DNA-T family DNA segregation ATPase FtsK/SpoIIIE